MLDARGEAPALLNIELALVDSKLDEGENLAKVSMI